MATGSKSRNAHKSLTSTSGQFSAYNKQVMTPSCTVRKNKTDLKPFKLPSQEKTRTADSDLSKASLPQWFLRGSTSSMMINR